MGKKFKAHIICLKIFWNAVYLLGAVKWDARNGWGVFLCMGVHFALLGTCSPHTHFSYTSSLVYRHYLSLLLSLSLAGFLCSTHLNRECDWHMVWRVRALDSSALQIACQHSSTNRQIQLLFDNSLSRLAGGVLSSWGITFFCPTCFYLILLSCYCCSSSSYNRYINNKQMIEQQQLVNDVKRAPKWSKTKQ